MTIMLAFLIAVVALSLMMTVLVASTRPLRAYDEPMFGARSASRAAKLTRGPHWMDLDRATTPSTASQAPRPTEHLMPPLPVPAPAKARPIDTPSPRRVTSGPRPINPNMWGRIRAEVGALETMRDRAASIPA
jgi:hypothetical protein